MKKIISVLTVITTLIFLNSGSMSAQDKIQMIELQVPGTCEMCKMRIEEASHIKGVKKATWDEQTQMLIVIYNQDKTSKEKITESILATGHNVNGHQADIDAYNRLPNCCAYNEDHGHDR